MTQFTNQQITTKVLEVQDRRNRLAETARLMLEHREAGVTDVVTAADVELTQGSIAMARDDVPVLLNMLEQLLRRDLDPSIRENIGKYRGFHERMIATDALLTGMGQLSMATPEGQALHSDYLTILARKKEYGERVLKNLLDVREVPLRLHYRVTVPNQTIWDRVYKGITKMLGGLTADYPNLAFDVWLTQPEKRSLQILERFGVLVTEVQGEPQKPAK